MNSYYFHLLVLLIFHIWIRHTLTELQMWEFFSFLVPLLSYRHYKGNPCLDSLCNFNFFFASLVKTLTLQAAICLEGPTVWRIRRWKREPVKQDWIRMTNKTQVVQVTWIHLWKKMQIKLCPHVQVQITKCKHALDTISLWWWQLVTTCSLAFSVSK